jgi:hypothetical protein
MKKNNNKSRLWSSTEGRLYSYCINDNDGMHNHTSDKSQNLLILPPQKASLPVMFL